MSSRARNLDNGQFMVKNKIMQQVASTSYHRVQPTLFKEKLHQQSQKAAMRLTDADLDQLLSSEKKQQILSQDLIKEQGQIQDAGPQTQCSEAPPLVYQQFVARLSLPEPVNLYQSQGQIKSQPNSGNSVPLSSGNTIDKLFHPSTPKADGLKQQQ